MYVIRCSKRSQCKLLEKRFWRVLLFEIWLRGFFTCWSAFLIVNIQPLGNCSSLINLDRMHDLTRNVLDESSMRYWWMELMRLISMLAALHVLMTCQFIERSLWQVRPRFKQETNVIKTVLFNQWVTSGEQWQVPNKLHEVRSIYTFIFFFFKDRAMIICSKPILH